MSILTEWTQYRRYRTMSWFEVAFWPAEASVLPSSALPASYTGDPLVWLRHQRWYFCTNRSNSLTDVDSIISQRRHALFGHIRRLPPDTPAHKVLHIHMAIQKQRRSFRPDITWWCPQGRPRLTWLQQLTDDIGISASRLWDSAADQSEWPALRPIAGSRYWFIDWMSISLLWK